jgi:hypothetical protein
MKSLIKSLKAYLKILFVKTEVLEVDFLSESDTRITLRFRFYGKKTFTKNHLLKTDWCELNSYLLYNGINDSKIKKLKDYPGGVDYEYALNLVIDAMLEREEIKGIWKENLRNSKLETLLN